MIDYPITNLTVRELRDMIREVVREVVREEADGVRDLEGSVSDEVTIAREAVVLAACQFGNINTAVATHALLAARLDDLERAIRRDERERKESVKATEVDQTSEIG